MAISVVMPALEMAQETGKLLAWRKKEGQATVKGEPLLEIETDKAVVEVEASADGILAGVKSHEGDVVAVGAVIAWILQPGEVLPAEASAAVMSAPSARAVTAPATTSVAATSVAAVAKESGGVGGDAAAKISPKARRLAKEHGVDIALIHATGPDGTISTEDVLAYVAAANAAPAAAARPAPATGGEPLGQIARIIAERTTQSWTTVPHFFVTREVDATALLAYQKIAAAASDKSGATRVTINDVLIALVARALRKHPRINSSWTGDNIRSNPDINISVAMAVSDGVVGAVIHNADKTALGEIATQRRELSERARGGKLRPADISDGTFTVSNLGMFDVDAFTAIITPPQAAILAVAKIVERVVAVDGQIVVRPMLTVTLSSDHRVVDGARAAGFLNDVVDAIRQPEKWLRD